MPKQQAQPQDETAYAGRWVARLHGRIVGQGGTPEEARQAAQAMRHKENPEIAYIYPAAVPVLPPLLDKIAEISQDQDVHLVGGSVRDALLGKVSHDLDLAVAGDAISLARRIAGSLGADFYVLDEEHGEARVIVQDSLGNRDVLDFATFRGGGILSDLEGRDFTINAIALDLKSRTTLDPLRGASDIRSKTIRACTATALQDDPIRILRGVRLAAALGFTIESGTRNVMRAAASLLETTSPERQRDELFRMLDGPRPDACLRALDLLEVLPHFLPELTALKGLGQPTPHVQDAWEHTLSVMQHLKQDLDLLVDEKLEDANGIHASLLTLGIGRYRSHLVDHYRKRLNRDRTVRALLMLASLYHDVGKPSTSSRDADGRIHFLGHEQQGALIATQRARKFNLSNAEVARLDCIIRNHLCLFFLGVRMEEAREPPSRRAIHRFFRNAGESGIDLILLGLADLQGNRGHTLTETTWSAWIDVARALLENLLERPEESVSPPRLISGHDLMAALDLEPGPIVGELLASIEEAQAAGELATAQEALDFGRRWLSERVA